jgi:hypothetical protein
MMHILIGRSPTESCSRETIPMTTKLASDAYDALTFALRDEEGVHIQEDGMYVHGRLFAFLLDDDLVVELPTARMADLELRGVAEPFSTPRHPTRDWVRIADSQLWPELAGEAHEYVGEPQVGGES